MVALRINRLSGSATIQSRWLHAPLGANRAAGRRRSREAGMLTTELIISLAILVAVALPLAFAFYQEMKLCRAYYSDAIAMEIVDGEMEVLAAGEWRAFPEGQQDYPVRAEAARNLPPGRFVLSRTAQKVRLEWRPAKPGRGHLVAREVMLP